MKGIGCFLLFLTAWAVNAGPVAPHHKESYSIQGHGGAETLDMDFIEVREAMKLALVQIRDALNIVNANVVLVFFNNDESLMQQLLDAYEGGNSEMTKHYYDFLVLTQLVPIEEFPQLTQETVDFFLNGIAGGILEAEKIVNEAGVNAEIIEQVKAIDNVFMSATKDAVQPVLDLIPKANK